MARHGRIHGMPRSCRRTDDCCMSPVVLGTGFVYEVEAEVPDVGAIGVRVRCRAVKLVDPCNAVCAGLYFPRGESATVGSRADLRRVRKFLQPHAAIQRASEINPAVEIGAGCGAQLQLPVGSSQQKTCVIAEKIRSAAGHPGGEPAPGPILVEHRATG